MPKPILSTASVLEMRGRFRLVDRTESAPMVHEFCVERNIEAGWELVQKHITQESAVDHFEIIAGL